MKRILSICIAILYIAITSGFTVNVHYCMGKIAAVKLQSHTHNGERCNKCGKEGHCCKDEFKFCKIDLSHEAVKAPVVAAPFTIDLHLPQIILALPEAPRSQLLAVHHYHAPPEDTPIPIYIKNRVFLI